MTFNISMTTRLVYPVRVGEHSNSAFGLAMALDYTRFVSEDDKNIPSADGCSTVVL